MRSVFTAAPLAVTVAAAEALRAAKAAGSPLGGDSQIIYHEGARWIVPHDVSYPAFRVPPDVALGAHLAAKLGRADPTAPKEEGPRKSSRASIAAELATRAATVSMAAQAIAAGEAPA